jgi:hypothetical protein
MSEPIVLPGSWRAVMKAAGFRCQCTGECGSAHRKGGGRCPREHDQHASKHSGPIHLSAAPADPATPTVQAARLPLAQLRAWCPACRDGARRASERAARSQLDPEQGSLFAL